MRLYRLLHVVVSEKLVRKIDTIGIATEAASNLPERLFCLLVSGKCNGTGSVSQSVNRTSRSFGRSLMILPFPGASSPQGFDRWSFACDGCNAATVNFKPGTCQQLVLEVDKYILFPVVLGPILGIHFGYFEVLINIVSLL